ncbi:hypothetical protein BHM03_00028952 [Ensete ventricosum]|uniref:Glycosyl transferase CAP10 domain-containing protein n=1 Tax=Ensete ventricosum TaxID=4639 RepID=A0A445MI32_ENSVE|nr:hypothetical protein BHM03_00028952 [Ensete ventricosum]
MQDYRMVTSMTPQALKSNISHSAHPPPKPQPKPIALTCGNQTTAPICQRQVSASAVPSRPPTMPRSSASCPDYFRWIYEDLRPWETTGITREMVGSARKFATFRLVVLDGRVYVEHYGGGFQTRDVFTLWGLLQLANRYPGRIPNLELMFNCNDTPSIKYKIFVEGRAWSVSNKYMLACDSPALFVRTHFHDFFSRGLMPGLHYWPIREDDKCSSIKFAVDWGNKHQEEVCIYILQPCCTCERCVFLIDVEVAGRSHGKSRKQAHERRSKDGVRLRLHATSTHPIREAVEVQAYSAGESYRVLLGVCGLSCHRHRQEAPDGVDGEVDRGSRAVQNSPTIQSGGASRDNGEKS